jgi:hypothetical protein
MLFQNIFKFIKTAEPIHKINKLFNNSKTNQNREEEIMSIGGNIYPWNENNVNAVRTQAGVYAFYDESRELIYIGSSNNLRERFQGYWNSNFEDDSCKRDTRYYRRGYTNNYEQKEYQAQHGHLPRCNDRIP